MKELKIGQEILIGDPDGEHIKGVILALDVDGNMKVGVLPPKEPIKVKTGERLWVGDIVYKDDADVIRRVTDPKVQKAAAIIKRHVEGGAEMTFDPEKNTDDFQLWGTDKDL